MNTQEKDADYQLRLTHDFRAAFNHPEGQRALGFILTQILEADKVAPPGLSGEDAVRMLALKSAAIKIQTILYRRLDDTAPVTVKTSAQRRHDLRAGVTN